MKKSDIEDFEGVELEYIEKTKVKKSSGTKKGDAAKKSSNGKKRNTDKTSDDVKKGSTKKENNVDKDNISNKNVKTKKKESAKNDDVENESTSGGALKVLALVTLFAIAVVAIMFGTKYIKDGNAKGSGNSDGAIVTTAETTTPAPIKDFVGLKDITKSVNINKFLTYGTSLLIEGDMQELVIAEDDKLSFILKNRFTNPDGSISKTFNEFTAYTSVDENGKVSFKSYDRINNGINLENIAVGEYIIVLRNTKSTGEIEEYTLKNSKDMEGIDYYTVTKNGENNKVNMSILEHEGNKYFSVDVAKSQLPDDVYDIVLDPGHGGNDPGANNGEYCESVLMLSYAKDVKAQLEKLGYKVLLTRDGSESSDEWMAYTMYDENGRVNVAARSKAKICLSLHLNSNAYSLTEGGIQMYHSFKSNGLFAKHMVDTIIEKSGTYASPMSAFKEEPGVYSRGFDAGDIEENRSSAIRDGYEPYNVEIGTDYYFMIREVGGMATNAYVDGRNPKYGSNESRNTRNCVESCIIELGFISVDKDLKHIVENQAKYVDGIVAGLTTWFDGKKHE